MLTCAVSQGGRVSEGGSPTTGGGGGSKDIVRSKYAGSTEMNVSEERKGQRNTKEEKAELAELRGFC